MSRSLRIRKPQAADVRQLHHVFAGALSPGPRRRAEALLLYAAGLTAGDIAHVLDVHVNTIYADLHAFGTHGVAAVHHLSRGGAPPRITAAQLAEVWRLADMPPYALGLPYGRWSLAKFRDYLIKHRVLPPVSREHLRRLLKKGGCAFAESSAS
jgi:transposase